MSIRTRCAVVLLFATLVLQGTAGRVEAQACTGDCSGQGRVTIRDLVLAVNIALGRAPAEQCASLGSGTVSIAQLIASVSNALCGCAPCPTRPPTATATPTAPSTPTPTASFTPTLLPTAAPDASTWRENNIKIPSSTCPQAFTSDLRRQLSSIEVSYTARVAAGVVELEDEGGTATGVADADGTIHVDYGITQSDGACSVTLLLPLTVNLSHSPTTATYAATVTSLRCPTTLNCTMRITSRWTRVSSAARRVGSSLRAALRLTP